MIYSTKSLLLFPPDTSLIPRVFLKPPAIQSFSLLTPHTASENIPLLFIQSKLQKGSPELSFNKSLLLPRDWIRLPRKIVSSTYTYSRLKWIISVLPDYFATQHSLSTPQAPSIHPRHTHAHLQLMVWKLCPKELETHQ